MDNGCGLMQPQLSLKRFEQTHGQHGVAVFLPLAIAHRDLALLHIKIFHAQAQAFQQPQATPIQQLGHELMGTRHGIKQTMHLRATQHGREMLRLFGACRSYCISHWLMQYFGIQKEQRTQRLILG